MASAPSAWYDKLKTALLDWGFINSKSDSSLFIHKKDDKVLYVLIYVDDILLTGPDSTLIQNLVQHLNAKFSDLGSLHYFLGLEAYRNSSGIHLSQTKYAVDLLAKTKMLEAHSCNTPMALGTK